MKQIIFTLCVFIALATVDNAAAFYDCVDKDGNSIITDNPPPGTKCKSRSLRQRGPGNPPRPGDDSRQPGSDQFGGRRCRHTAHPGSVVWPVPRRHFPARPRSERQSGFQRHVAAARSNEKRKQSD